MSPVAAAPRHLWHRLFLQERPSLMLSLFRVFAAAALGGHLIPSFFVLEDTYLSTAFKTFNTNFFPTAVIEWVQKSPDALVIAMVAVFMIAWLCFLLGLFTWPATVLTVLGCYYFYALNYFATGHCLTWDILLVVLVLLCFSPYHGDWLSLDQIWRRRDSDGHHRMRPFFIQRLLQMQLAFTYFYTGLHKITVEGNWLTDKPIYYLMHQPGDNVTKWFLLRDFLGARPHLCYIIGLIVVGVEIAMPVLLWWKKTRPTAIYLGLLFHVTLILTLDVPAIFFFLFPGMLLLFLDPEEVARWIDFKREQNARIQRPVVVYDGRCGFCVGTVRRLAAADLFGAVCWAPYDGRRDPRQWHPSLTDEALQRRMHLIEPSGGVHGGFAAFRRLCWIIPVLWPCLVVVYAPFAGLIGERMYRFIARHRHRLGKAVCSTGGCDGQPT